MMHKTKIMKRSPRHQRYFIIKKFNHITVEEYFETLVIVNTVKTKAEAEEWAKRFEGIGNKVEVTIKRKYDETKTPKIYSNQ